MSKVNILQNQPKIIGMSRYSRKLVLVGLSASAILLIYICANQYSEYIKSTDDRRSAAYLHEKWANNNLYEVKDELALKNVVELVTKSSEMNDVRYPNYTQKELDTIQASKECYESNVSLANVQLLDDIEKSPPKPDKPIFFINTSCMRNYSVIFNARETCAVESAAKLNPNRDIFVLFVSPVGFGTNEKDSPLIGALKSYPNVYFRNVNVREFSKNTPAEKWIQEDRIFLSDSFKYHLSDYLRLIALYKFGGIYFDFDFIIVKSVDILPPNFAPQEKNGDDYINNSALGFESKNVGHKMVEMILRECFEKYNPKAWDWNGPYAIQRVARAICNTTKTDLMRPEKCWGLKIMKQEVLFPLAPFDEAFQTEPNLFEKAMNKITNDTVAIHTWSSNTKNVHISKTDKPSAYTTFAQQVCPKSFEATGINFTK